MKSANYRCLKLSLLFFFMSPVAMKTYANHLAYICHTAVGSILGIFGSKGVDVHILINVVDTLFLKKPLFSLPLCESTCFGTSSSQLCIFPLCRFCLSSRFLLISTNPPAHFPALESLNHLTLNFLLSSPDDHAIVLEWGPFPG